MEQHIVVFEANFQELQKQHMQIVSDCNLLESKISSSLAEQHSIDSRIASIIASLDSSDGSQNSIEEKFSINIQDLDKQLSKVSAEKRVLSGSSSWDSFRLELNDMISDSVSSIALMHLSPEELLSHFESKKTSVIEKIESSLKSLSCACPSQTGTQVQSSPEIELAGARQTLALFTSMKSKSVAEVKCNLCRQKLTSIEDFEAAIDKLTRKLPDIISINEAKMASSAQSANGTIEELRRTLIPELIECEKTISRIQALMEAASRLTSSTECEAPADRERRLENYDKLEQELSAKKSETFIQRDSYKALIERKAAIETVLEDFRMELAILKDDKVDRKFKEMESSKESLLKQKQTLNEKVNLFNLEKSKMDSELNSMRNSFQIIFQIASQVDSLRGKLNSGSGAVDPAVAELTSLEARETELGNQLTKTMNSMSGLEDERSSIDSQISPTRIEIEKVKNRIEYCRLEGELQSVQSEIGGSGSGMMIQETTGLVNEVKRLRDDRSKLIGESNQIQNQITEIDKKLNSSSYLDVDEKYRQAFCCMETHNVLAKDVQRYHQALDRALMNYHSQKMSEINELIRDLWGRIYRGTDIDYIAIRSDTENEDGENNPALPAKRSYNYRVVMVKGDVELEMRGRCSAGQKVVACLIIRLALAESFCLSCGILALDEPTTNLDRGNIGGLAEALAELIATRRDQRNFQLIIITHDESFVNMLGNLRACDHFFRVSKNEFGHSTLSRSHIHEIHTRAR